MKKTLRELNSFVKGFILFLRPGVYLGFLSTPFLFFSNLLRLTKWISKQKKQGMLNDFYRPVRKYSDRVKLYEYVSDKENLQDQKIVYLEFGVFQGSSFKWWMSKNRNPGSRFFGFDTFEGLPESWGTYGRGDMKAVFPDINDERGELIKGLFQTSLYQFLHTHSIDEGRRVIHMDADLFSSTLFVLTTIASHLEKNDIILFDEFNVPNHEFFAFKIFTESFYKKFELLGAVNNYYQVAFKMIE
jgi:O-methyltransferase